MSYGRRGETSWRRAVGVLRLCVSKESRKLGGIVLRTSCRPGLVLLGW